LSYSHAVAADFSASGPAIGLSLDNKLFNRVFSASSPVDPRRWTAPPRRDPRSTLHLCVHSWRPCVLTQSRPRR